MSKTVAITILFTALLFFVGGEIFHLKSQKKTHSIQGFVQLTGISDMALYSGVLPVRFYSLESVSDLWDDPLLMPRTNADFVYRMHP